MGLGAGEKYQIKQMRDRMEISYDFIGETLNLWRKAVNSRGGEMKATFNALIGIFDICRFKALTQQLIREIHQIKEKNSQPELTDCSTGVWFDVRNPASNFTGRKVERDQLHKCLCPTNSIPTTEQQYTIVGGLGGVGKSDLVRKFVQLNFSYFEGNVIWINAQSLLTLSDSFRRLKVRLNILPNVENPPIQEIVHQAYFYFRDKKVLFIFDNAQSFKSSIESGEDGIYDFLPIAFPTFACKSRPSILITTRNKDIILGDNVNLILLKVFQTEESEEFINFSLRGCLKCDHSEVAKLGHILEYLPLPLQQAVAYIVQENRKRTMMGRNPLTITNYIELFEKETQKLLDFPFPTNSTNTTYEKTTFTTWKITFERIGEDKEFGSMAIYALTAMAYLAPENIDLEMIIEICQKVKDICVPVTSDQIATAGDSEHFIFESLDLSQRYCMCSIQMGGVGIHRLVQHVLRLHVQADDGELGILEMLLQFFSDKYKEYTSILQTNHVASVWFHSGASKCRKELIKPYYKLAHCISTDLVIGKGTVKAGEEFGEKSIPILKEVFGEDDEVVHEFMNGAAATLEICGKFQDSVEMRKEISSIQDRTLGPGHPNTIRTKLAIASTLNVMGKLDQLDEASRIIDGLLSGNYEISKGQIADIQEGIARNFYNLRQYEQALSIYEEVVKIKTDLYGEDDTRTLHTKSTMAATLRAMRKYKEASDLYKKIANTCFLSVGPSHPLGRSACRCVGYVLQDQGKYKEALGIFEHVLKFELGVVELPDVPCINTRLPTGADTTWNNIAWALLHMGQYEKGLKICDNILIVQNRTFGEENPSTLITSHTKAHLLQASGETEQAMDIHTKNYAIRQSVFGENDSCTASSLYGIGLSVKSNQDYIKAKGIFEDVLTTQKEKLGHMHQHTLETQFQVASVTFLSGDQMNGLAELQKHHKVVQDLFGNEHPITLTAIEEIANAYWTIGDFKVSFQMYAKLCELSANVLGLDHPIHRVRLHNKNAVLQADLPNEPVRLETLESELENAFHDLSVKTFQPN